MSAGKLELRLLGGLQVRVDGAVVALPGRKVRGLLCRLAMPAGQTHSRDALCGLLWGDSGHEQARNSLRQALFALRKALPGRHVGALQCTVGDVRLEAALVSTDVDKIESIATQAVETIGANRINECMGELLAGLSVGEEAFEAWLQLERDRLRSLQVAQLTRLAKHQEQRRQWTEAANTWSQALRIEPWAESHHRALITLYGRMGRRTAVLKQYQDCVATLRRELSVAPCAATRTAYERWSQDPPALAASLRSKPSHTWPLIGRAAELAQLRQAWSRVGHERENVVLLKGEAGIGKTRLLDELSSDLDSAVILRGRSFESEHELPLGLWADAIRAEARIFGEPLWSSLPQVAQSAALTLVPGFVSAASDAPDSQRMRSLFEGFNLLLETLSTQSNVLVMLDDIQWADHLSLRLLSFIVRHQPAGQPVLFLATLRTQDVADRPEVAATLDELTASGRVTELCLGTLNRQQTSELASSSAGRDGATGIHTSGCANRDAAYEERVWLMSEGNPFVITEAARAEPQPAAGPNVPLPMPARVRDLVLRHLSRMQDRDRALVSLAAAIGREFDFVLLEALWLARGRAATEVAGGIERLTQSGIFSCTHDRGYFAHDRIREVAYDTLLTPRRRALHREVATRLAGHHSQHAQAAHHYALADDPESAINCLLGAAEDAARRLGLGEAMSALDQATPLLEAVCPGRQADLRVRIATRRAGYLGYQGRLGEVEACLLAERDQLAYLDNAGLKAMYFSALGYTHSLAGDTGAATIAGEHALTAALAIDNKRMERRARALLAYNAAHSGCYARGIENGKAAMRITLRPETDPEHAVLACCNLALNQLHSGDCDGALSTLGLGMQRCDASGITRERGLVTAFTGLVLSSMGEHERAAHKTQQALCLASDPMGYVMSASQRLFAHVASGGGAAKFSLNGRNLVQFLQQVEGAGNCHGLGLAVLYGARAHCNDFNPPYGPSIDARTQALALARQAERLFDKAGDPRGAALAWVVEGLAVGRDKGGQGQVARAIDTLHQIGARLDLADAHLAMALLAVGSESATHRSSAVSHYQRLGLPRRAVAASTGAYGTSQE